MDSDFPCKILTIGDEWTGQDFVADIRDCYIIQLVFIRDSFRIGPTENSANQQQNRAESVFFGEIAGYWQASFFRKNVDC